MSAPDAAPQPLDDPELDESKLDPSALRIKKAFTQHRVTQLFHPVISLTNDETPESKRDIRRVGLQLVDQDGGLAGEGEIYQTASEPAFRKFIDRWQIRETIGHVVNNKPDTYLFLLPLSEASLADPGLFNWLRKLLAGLDNHQPGKSIALELSAKNFLELEKPAAALMAYLHKSHGFRFVLDKVKNADDLSVASRHGLHFYMVLMHSPLFKELKSSDDQVGPGGVLEKMRAQGLRIMVDDITDATSLTDTIALGAEFAMGPFVGGPVQQLDEAADAEPV